MSNYSQPRLSNAMAFLIFAKNALRSDRRWRSRRASGLCWRR